MLIGRSYESSPEFRIHCLLPCCLVNDRWEFLDGDAEKVLVVLEPDNLGRVLRWQKSCW